MTHRLAPVGVVAVVLLATAGVYVLAPGAHPAPRSAAQPDRSTQAATGTAGGAAPDSTLDASGAAPPAPEPANLTTFESAADFAAYLRAAGTPSGDGDDRVARETRRRRGATATPTPMATEAAGGDGGGAAPDRHSDTNVQVEDVAEPDLVKTNGRQIYYSPRDEREPHHHHTAREGHDHEHDDPGTRVIDAAPPGTAEAVAEIQHSGQMFLDGDRLVVVGESVWGYDVSDPADPELVWTRSLSDRVRTARMHEGTVYLVLASPIDRSAPCPVEPMGGVNVSCTGVYHPDRPVPVSVTYTVVALDPGTGDVDDALSAVGARDSTVYASGDGLYLTYTERTSRADVRLDVLLGDARPLVPDRVAAHLRAVGEYNLSERATAVEIDRTIDRWLAGLDEERRHEIRKELHERTEAYVREHRRELTTTHVVRVNATAAAARMVPGANASLSVAGAGAVPGRPLDQFSIDQHEGSLRIATTVGERWGAESVNDVYVLDAATLERTGAVTGMGETERIYSVRFVGDRGYVVTFRRVDPFHVLDLSNASAPSLEGTLKLPGYSSYLHPLSGDRVLGIGEEDGEVKAVIFDVSDPTDPTIAASRVLDADRSAIARSHHAFLRDEKHGVFFLPTEDGGTVLSTSDLRTVHEIDVDDPQRALYIDDYLYVFGDDELAVVDETDWERVETVPL